MNILITGFLLNLLYFSVKCQNVCNTTDGIPCIFPFVYDKMSYDGCTTVDNNGMQWCATSLFPSKEANLFGNCEPDCKNATIPDPNACQTFSGYPCVFPFKYDGKTYNSCVPFDNADGPWCATSVKSDGYFQNFSTCLPGCRTTVGPTDCKTVAGENCTFPFSYSGVEYNACSTVDTEVPWCATSLFPGSRDVLGWNYCSSDCGVAPTKTMSGCLTTDGLMCEFPFMYDGKNYTKCTSVDNNGTDWCAITTSGTGEVDLFGDCDQTNPYCNDNLTTPVPPTTKRPRNNCCTKLSLTASGPLLNHQNSSLGIYDALTERTSNDDRWDYINDKENPNSDRRWLYLDVASNIWFIGPRLNGANSTMRLNDNTTCPENSNNYWSYFNGTSFSNDDKTVKIVCV